MRIKKEKGRYSTLSLLLMMFMVILVFLLPFNANASVAVSNKIAHLHEIFSDAASGNNTNVTYIISGDSTRDNSFNYMIPYYTSQFDKANVIVVNNASSGLDAQDWNANVRPSASLQNAIDNTEGTGTNTIMEYSLGINDQGRGASREEQKLRYKTGITNYLAAKPDATVVLVVPVAHGGSAGNTELKDIYTEIAQELDLILVDGLYATESVYSSTDPDYYQDGTHPNQWGSRRVVNYVMDQILPSNLYSVVTLEEAPNQPATNNNELSLGAENGYYSDSTGYWGTPAGNGDTNYWRLKEIDVEPNFILKVKTGASRNEAFFMNAAGECDNKTYLGVISGDYVTLTIPPDGVLFRLTLCLNCPDYNPSNDVISVKYDVNNVNYMSIDDINAGLNIRLEKADGSGGSTNPPIRDLDSAVAPIIRTSESDLGGGGYTALEGEDGHADMRKGVAWPNPRFTDNGDGTVKDNLTDLIWMKDMNSISNNHPSFDNDGIAGDGEVVWTNALNFVAGMNAGTYTNYGYTDWRLPNTFELQSVIDYAYRYLWAGNVGTLCDIIGTSQMSEGNPWNSLPSGMYYWTSTADPVVSYSRVVGFRDGRLDNWSQASDCYVWAVRSTATNTTLAPLPKTGATGGSIAGEDAHADMQAGVEWPNPRFTDNGDGTVNDNLTGLCWLKEANSIEVNHPAFDNDDTAGDGMVVWTNALNFVAGMNAGTYTNYGYTDWRLPNVREMYSLVYGNAREPTLCDTTGTQQWQEGQPFNNVQSATYWSSTTYPNGTYAYYVDMAYGRVLSNVKEHPSSSGYTRFVWPVRTTDITPRGTFFIIK